VCFVAALSIVAALVFATLRFTDLTPRVDRGFFFSDGSGAIAQATSIEALFQRHAQLVIIASSPDLASETYLNRIEELEEEIGKLDGVLGSQSLESGPGDYEEAQESPLWSRLLLSGDGSATHLLLFAADPWPESLIPALEAIVERHRRPDFDLSIAGVPYTVTVMQRQLVRDFSRFSAIAAAGFGFASLLLFRSVAVAIAVVASCTGAVAITFLILQAAGASLGLLSANLVTIVFVLTQSHLVFLTWNWKTRASGGEAGGALPGAIRETLAPSLASMATTLLGFGTLLLVDAKPLRELGLGGVVGGAVAFAVAYSLYPLFLVGRSAARDARGQASALRDFFRTPHPRLALGGVAVCVILAMGLLRLDTDPSLLAYFDREGEVYEALEYLDAQAGSAPLELVLRRADGRELLDDPGGYESLWEVQHAFEAMPEVGRVVSLPVVLAEGERFPLSFVLKREWMLRLLESPLFDRVGRSFVSEDGIHTLFALQMVEHRRSEKRVEVIEHLRSTAARKGFEIPLVGGVFYLQGALSELVARSMIESLAMLAVLFTAIGWASTRSLRVASSMVLVLALVPCAVFGVMGALRIPVDVVTAPAASVGLGLSADLLIHLAIAARRSRTGSGFCWNAWKRGLRSQSGGILRATLIVALGFGLFAFSGFPPTRRFGVAVAASMVVAAPLALVVLPWLASRKGGGED
jgi:predicted RND superfamily exporter protein